MNTKLKAARKLVKLTQKQVAESVKVSETSYQRIEYGKQRPSLQTALLIAREMNSTVEALFGAATPK